MYISFCAGTCFVPGPGKARYPNCTEDVIQLHDLSLGHEFFEAAFEALCNLSG